MLGIQTPFTVSKTLNFVLLLSNSNSINVRVAAVIHVEQLWLSIMTWVVQAKL